MSARKLSGVMMRRKSSEGLLDTADDLAEKLDCLGDILEEIDHKYSEVSFQSLQWKLKNENLIAVLVADSGFFLKSVL